MDNLKNILNISSYSLQWDLCNAFDSMLITLFITFWSKIPESRHKLVQKYESLKKKKGERKTESTGIIIIKNFRTCWLYALYRFYICRSHSPSHSLCLYFSYSLVFHILTNCRSAPKRNSGGANNTSIQRILNYSTPFHAGPRVEYIWYQRCGVIYYCICMCAVLQANT